MSLKFLEQFGFKSDPFEFANADQEPHLESYFVPPPYFSSVLGDPSNPKSTVILAPRGGGKSAQRRMIELRTDAAGEALVVPYSDFNFATKAGVVSRETHLTEISKSILLGILIDLALEKRGSRDLTGYERDFLLECSQQLLGKLDQDQLSLGLRSLRTPGERVITLAKSARKPIKALLAASLAKYAKLKVSPEDLSLEGSPEPAPNNVDEIFKGLVGVAQYLGYSGVYVLVDKVDELGFTTKDARAAFELISALVLDLGLLETEGVAFKFFLWDQVEHYLTEAGFRRDRITRHTLNWKPSDLHKALSERLSAYSDGQVTSLQQLCESSIEVDIDRLVVCLAHGSPRDAIRLAGRIVAEATKEDECPSGLTQKSIWEGIRSFSNERADDLFPGVADLRRIGKPTFLMKELASDILRVNDNSARRRVQLWQDTGLLSKVGEVSRDRAGRPQYIYGPTDVRLLIASLPTLSVEEILGNYAILCPGCNGLLLDDRTEIVCLHCSHTVELRTATTLLSHCAHPGN